MTDFMQIAVVLLLLAIASWIRFERSSRKFKRDIEAWRRHILKNY